MAPNRTGRVTSTALLNLTLLSVLLQAQLQTVGSLYHSDADSSAHLASEVDPYFNIAQDLRADTASSGFNNSNWLCLDRYLDEYNRTYELESIVINPFSRFWATPSVESLATCKYFINSRCEKLEKISLWFRSYELDDVNATRVFNSFLDSLVTGHIIKEISSKLVRDPLAICSESTALSLHVDLVRGDYNLEAAGKFLQQLDGHPQIHLESLSLRNYSLDSSQLSFLSNLTHLKSLNLTFTNLTDFDGEQFFSPKSPLVTLDLSHNQLTRANLNQLVNLKSINLSFNRLTSLSRSQLSVDVKSLHTFKLFNNPWHCDAHLHWLISDISTVVEANGGNAENELKQTYEPECTTPGEYRKFQFSVMKSVKEVSICGTCRCHMDDKYTKQGYRYMIVNCTGRHLESLPADLPKNAKIIDLSNNRIRKWSTSGAKLWQWQHVNKVILQNNSLEILDGLDHIASIVYLDISGNLLTEIPYHILDMLTKKTDSTLLIGNNPYTCDCNTVKMQKWMQTNYRIILDIANVRCGYVRTELTKNESNIVAQLPSTSDRFHRREILKINNLELCPSIASVEFFDIINGILAFSIIFLLAKVIYDHFWQKRTGQLPKFWKLNI